MYLASEQCDSLVIMVCLHCVGCLSTPEGTDCSNGVFTSLSTCTIIIILWAMLQIHVRNVTPEHTVVVNSKNLFCVLVWQSSFNMWNWTEKAEQKWDCSWRLSLFHPWFHPCSALSQHLSTLPLPFFFTTNNQSADKAISNCLLTKSTKMFLMLVQQLTASTSNQCFVFLRGQVSQFLLLNEVYRLQPPSGVESCHAGARSKSFNRLTLVSWTSQWVRCTQMASAVTRSQANRAPWGCGGMRNTYHLHDAIMSIRTKISEKCFQHLVESRPQRIQAVLTAKGDSTW